MLKCEEHRYETGSKENEQKCWDIEGNEIFHYHNHKCWDIKGNQIECDHQLPSKL